MSHQVIGHLAPVLLAVLAVLVLSYFILMMSGQRLLAPSKSRKGSWVAEVWLDWDICRGSTMYRQRYRTKLGAYLAVRFHAFVLDLNLPTHYRDTDWSGRPCLYKYDYGINYGVRTLTASEREEFRTVWTTELPGHRGFAGEHAMFHPLEKDIELKGNTYGYKI